MSKLCSLLVLALLTCFLMTACSNTKEESKEGEEQTDPTKVNPLSKANLGTKAYAKSTGISKSGYVYELFTKNEGPKPIVGDEVRYHELLFKNDSLVKSTMLLFEPIRAVMPSRDKVATPPPPTYDALFLMSVGDSLMTYHTLDTFRNYQLPGWLNPKDTLYYSLKLLNIRPKDAIDKEQAALKVKEETVSNSTKALILDYKAGRLDNQLKTTESGLKYIIHETGTGEKAENGRYVKVNFAGFLMDGTPYDNSFKKGMPYPFKLGNGRVLKGWDEGVLFLSVGSKATFFLPYQLAYGDAGRPPAVPERSDMAFYIELVEMMAK